MVVMFRKGFRGNARAARRSQAQLRLHGVDKRRIHGSTSGRVGGAALSGAIGACGTSTSPGQPADIIFSPIRRPPPDKNASGCSPRAAAHRKNLQPLVAGPRGEASASLGVAGSVGGGDLCVDRSGRVPHTYIFTSGIYSRDLIIRFRMSKSERGQLPPKR